MPTEEAILKITGLSGQSSGGRFRDFRLSGKAGSLILVTSEDRRKITSLFLILAGLEKPLAGTYEYKGEGIGLILADDELPPWSSPQQELALYGALKKLSPHDLQQKMESWDLEGIGHLAARHLSPYEKTAFFLLLETAGQPDLLLCQEPLAGLSQRQTQRMLEHLEEYARDHLLILGSVHPGLYPNDLPRFDLDRPGQMPEASPDFFTRVRQPGGEAEKPPVKVLETPAKPSPSPEQIGSRRIVTLRADLPVSEETSYQLRRIPQIKFFEPTEGGYVLDILEADKERLADLLSERGLLPPEGGMTQHDEPADL